VVVWHQYYNFKPNFIIWQDLGLMGCDFKEEQVVSKSGQKSVRKLLVEFSKNKIFHKKSAESFD